MNNKSILQSIKILYLRYKDTVWYSLSIVIGILLISMVLIGRVVFPQTQNWFSIRKEAADTKVRIANLRANQAQLSATNESILNSQLKTVTSALPVEKDFAGVINAISSAGINSGVSFDDYSFIVGTLSTKSAELVQEPYLDLSVSIKGNISQVSEFLKEIYEKVPLAEINSVNYTAAGTGITLRFHYKVIPDKFPINYDKPLKSVEGANVQLLRTLEKWSKSTQANEVSENTATESATF